MTLGKAFNRFMSAASKDRLTPHEVTLYMTLLYRWNYLGHPAKVDMTNEEIMKKTGMTYRKILKSKKRLMELGYIRYTPGKKGMASEYILADDDSDK